MRIQVGNTKTEIEIGQYREVNKGALKAFFSFVEYPFGRKTIDCRYFVSGDKKWIAFTQKEIKKPDTDKPDYIPLVSYLDKEYDKELKKALLTALEENENNGQNHSFQKQENKLQDDPSSLWFR